MTDRSSAHATFTVERSLANPPARVYRAFADQASKAAAWFTAPTDLECLAALLVAR